MDNNERQLELGRRLEDWTMGYKQYPFASYFYDENMLKKAMLASVAYMIIAMTSYQTSWNIYNNLQDMMTEDLARWHKVTR